MNKSRFPACLAAGLVLATLAGCGGGGGGGGGTSPDDPVVYAGNNNAADISASNAGGITANVIGAVNSPASVASAAVVGIVKHNSGFEPADLSRRLSRSLQSTVSQVGQAGAGARLITAAIPIDQTDPCDSGSVRLVGTLNDDRTGTLTVFYNDCRFGDETLSGQATMRIDAFDLFNFAPIDSTLSFSRLKIRGPGISADRGGQSRLQVSLGTNTDIFTFNIVTHDNITGRMRKTENLVLVDIYDNYFFPSSFTETISGRVFHSVHGFVDIATNTQLIFGSLSQLFPGSGQISLTGLGSARIRANALSLTLVKLELDLDGDGVYERAATLNWADLTGPVGADLGDDDSDGMHNSWETANGLNPADPLDAALDSDADGASNLAEYEAGTDPRNAASVPPMAPPPPPAPPPAPAPGPQLPPGTWQPEPGSTPASGNYVYLQSDSGDFIGQGQTYTYTQANAQLTISATGGHLFVGVQGDEGWSGDFQVPSSLGMLEPGLYSGLQRYPFHDPAKGGLSWWGEGRGCNTLTGWFVIDSVTYANGVLTAVELRFEQHCEGGAAALRGKIRWEANDPTAPAGPVNPPPAGLWEPAPGSTPASGNYVYLQSDSGDFIGQGQTYLYTQANAQINVTSSGGLLTVSVLGSQGWGGEFRTMNSLSVLQPGYYGDLQRYPFHNPVKGGLSWSGEGRGCNTLTGWFVVESVTYASGVLTAIVLRFEQHCEGGAPALHGKIHWTG